MKKLLPILFIFLFVLILYYPVLTTYFSQDDFFMFKVSQTDGSLEGFIKLFGIYPFEERGIAFYRPIFREAFHNLYYQFFGLNHLPFRIILFLIHFFNIYLVYILMQKIFKQNLVSLFTAFFFGISTANVAILYYLAGGIESVGAMMFALLSLISYKNYIDNSKLKFRIFSFIFLILALASHEIILAIPLVLAGLVFISYPKNKAFQEITKLWPFLVLLLLFLYIDIFKIGFSQSEQQYKFVFSIKTLTQSFIWYLSWAFGLPEMLIDFILPGLKLNPNLMKYWGNFYRIIFSTSALSLILLSGFIVYLLIKSRSIIIYKKFIFQLFWVGIGILPVIFLPSHKSSHYLIFILPAFWAAIGYIIYSFYQDFKKKNQLISFVLLLIFIVSTSLLSITSTKLGHRNFWAATRGNLAEKLIGEVQSLYPSLPKGAVIYFKNDPDYPFLTREWGGTSKQASLVLNGSDALQLLYKDSTLKVFYEDLGGIPREFKENSIYRIMAKIL